MRLTERTLPIVMQLTRLVNYWKAYDRLGHEAAGEHFTAGEMQTIKAVAEFPHKNTTELAGELGVTKGAVSQAVTKLVDRGCLERYRGPDSERETFIRLTKHGSRVYQAHMKRYDAEVRAFDALLADAEPSQVAFMLGFLEKVEGFFREQLEEEAL